MGYFIIGDRLETLPRGLLGKRRHSTERLTINVYRLSLLGRTTTMDPLTEKYYSLSPYLWCAGNPVRFVDQYGMSVDEAFEFFSRSINYSVSIGAQLGFNINSGKNQYLLI